MRSRMPLSLITAAFAALLLLTSVCEAQTVRPVQIALITPVQLFPKETVIHGIALNFIYGENRDVQGLEFGLINHVTGSMGGLQYGFINLTDGDVQGAQWGFFSQAESGTGIQWGFVNIAHSYNGFQFGFLNMTHTMKGLQIGLVNVISAKEKFPVLPIVNWSF